uniref:THH1/TOM1/TOM3 domain-containing protein n=1 Tax=Bicosoecida sp. CB-2014 TaxID=1486930 RepID=A0A7S1CHV7_9STRA|mmetsp:Transcript_25447/g.88790  ORF Transcript_25447/g.88790 Transcript_25447/m.88790 type:complete len:428 (+) Transcript_25447:163-1446(+)
MAAAGLVNGDSAYFLALIYLVATVYAARKLYVIRLVSRGWETTTYLVGSILFACAVRATVFATLCALAEISTNAADSAGALDGGGAAPGGGAVQQTLLAHAAFYEKSVRVLFNLGDFLSVSCYLLLVVVWVETFQQSRRHWYSADRSRRRWMTTYLIFNIFLYAGQLAAYLLYFFLDPTSVDSQLLDLIYDILSAIDLFVPLVLVAAFVYYNCEFAGFPFRSVTDRDIWTKMSRLTMWWSIARAIWGAFSVVSVRYAWLQPPTAAASDSSLRSMVLVGTFVILELCPFAAALTSDLLVLLASHMGYLSLAGAGATTATRLGRNIGAREGSDVEGGGGGAGESRGGGGSGSERGSYRRPAVQLPGRRGASHRSVDSREDSRALLSDHDDSPRAALGVSVSSRGGDSGGGDVDGDGYVSAASSERRHVG